MARASHADVVMQGPTSSESALLPQWESVLDQREHLAVSIRAGHRIRLGPGVVMEVLHPPAGKMPSRIDANTNNLSVVIRLTYGEVSFLLTGDVEQDVEGYLVDTRGEGLRSNVLKVAHHGSHSSTSAAFLEAVAPESAVVSAGADNRYGHPHQDVIARLDAATGAENVFITAHDGTVEYITDGVGLWVRTSSDFAP